MVNLQAVSPCQGFLSATVKGVILTEVTPCAITSVAPFKGQREVVSSALMSLMGAGLPEPNRSIGLDDSRVIWVGPGQALVVGPPVAPAGAAITDQSDAWAVLRLSGPLAEAVLVRLVPLDLRLSKFQLQWTARTRLRHMTCSLTRVDRNTFDIMVFRSMAWTAVTELEHAMQTVAAQNVLLPVSVNTGLGLIARSSNAMELR